MPRLRQDRLRALLEYNPLTGDFVSSGTGRVPGSHAISGDITYRRIMIDGKRYYAHRLAWLYMRGRWPRHEIDHINGDGLDNRWENLRDVTRTEQCHNATRSTLNTSGVVGIRQDGNRWRATITVSGRAHWLGRFATRDDAILARKAAEKYYRFHPNHGREKGKHLPGITHCPPHFPVMMDLPSERW